MIGYESWEHSGSSYEEVTQPETDGYCTTELDNLVDINNANNCNVDGTEGASVNYGVHYFAKFVTLEASLFAFRVPIDLDQGGVMKMDGVEVS